MDTLKLLKIGGALAGLGVLAALVLVSGVVPISARQGHWPVTEWLLHFAMERSVATHSLGTDVPPLDDPGLVLRGAGHYESGCRPCHGGPLPRKPVVPTAMTPHPPDLVNTAPHWKDRELFYIVQQGVKMTGMPAWPARHRDDEVWAVVAFLRVLPRLDPGGYDELVFGGDDSSPAVAPSPGLDLSPVPVAAGCVRCHGMDGHGRGDGALPSLAGQSETYLLESLRAYAGGERASGIMQPLAAGLSDEVMRRLASHYAAQAPGGAGGGGGGRRTPPAGGSGEGNGEGRTEGEEGSAATARVLSGILDDDDEAPPPDLGSVSHHTPAPWTIPPASAADLERGRRIALEGLPARGVPSCADCHGPGPEERNPHYPSLAGQPAWYLVLQLELFQEGHRGGGEYAHLMEEIAPDLGRQQVLDVARYYAALVAEERGASP